MSGVQLALKWAVLSKVETCITAPEKVKITKPVKNKNVFCKILDATCILTMAHEFWDVTHLAFYVLNLFSLRMVLTMH